MRPNKNVLRLALAFAVLGAAPSFAQSVEFYAKFRNNSATAVEARLLLKDGRVGERKKIAPGSRATFELELACQAEDVRSFEIIHTETGGKVGDGRFTMKTGKKDGLVDCKYDDFTFDACRGNGLVVSCSERGKYMGNVEIR